METIQTKNELHKFVDSGDKVLLRLFYAMATEYEKTTKKIKMSLSKTEFINPHYS